MNPVRNQYQIARRLLREIASEEQNEPIFTQDYEDQATNMDILLSELELIPQWIVDRAASSRVT